MTRALSKTLLCSFLAAVPAGVAVAQQPAAPAVAARPADVNSLDGLIAALYDVISGPAGQKRDWDRMRTLFAPGARLIPTGKNQEGKGSMQMWTVEEYITRSGPVLERDGFFERELGRVEERYGNIVHAFSTYDSKRTLQDPKPFMRGINSIQAWFDGTRWWILNVFWESESPSNPIPPKYLNKVKD